MPEVKRAMSDFEQDQPVKETEWVSGIQLWILMLPLCCTFFLILLDISIIATVSNLSVVSPSILLTITLRQYLRLPMTSIHCPMWDGTERHINLPVAHCSH